MELIDELLEDAKERMAKSVESSRGELATVRTGRASPHLLDRIIGRLLRHPDAAEAAGQRRRLRRPPADRHALRQGRARGDREGDPGVRRRPDAEQRRQRDPPADPGADRGAAARDGQGRPRRRRGGPGRDPQHPPRHRCSDLRELKKEGEAGEDDERRAEAALQKQTDEAIAEIDALLKGKEEEILEV